MFCPRREIKGIFLTVQQKMCLLCLFTWVTLLRPPRLSLSAFTTTVTWPCSKSVQKATLSTNSTTSRRQLSTASALQTSRQNIFSTILTKYVILFIHFSSYVHINQITQKILKNFNLNENSDRIKIRAIIFQYKK